MRRLLDLVGAEELRRHLGPSSRTPSLPLGSSRCRWRWRPSPRRRGACRPASRPPRARRRCTARIRRQGLEQADAAVLLALSWLAGLRRSALESSAVSRAPSCFERRSRWRATFARGATRSRSSLLESRCRPSSSGSTDVVQLLTVALLCSAARHSTPSGAAEGRDSSAYSHLGISHVTHRKGDPCRGSRRFRGLERACLLDGHRLREVARLVDVRAAFDGDVVREQLHQHHRQ